MASNCEFKWIRNVATGYMERVQIDELNEESVSVSESTFERLSLLNIWRSDLGVDLLSNDGMSDLSEFTQSNYIYTLPTRQLIKSNNIKCRKCAICLESFNKMDTLKILPCHHEFHPKCIDRWLIETKLNCPICRSSLLKKM